MIDDSELTYVVGFITGQRFHAKAEYFDDIKDAMASKSCTDFIDVDGEPGFVNGRWIETIYLTSPKSRAHKVAHDAAVSGETPEEPWK